MSEKVVMVLHEIPIPNPPIQKGKLSLTMSPGQWDTVLEIAYEEGAVLLEVDTDKHGNEIITKAYQNPNPNPVIDDKPEAA